jgi:hypothetical protein
MTLSVRPSSADGVALKGGRQLVATILTALLAGLGWPAGIAIDVGVVLLALSLVAGYLATTLAIIATRSSFDAFTDVGFALAGMRFNLASGAALFVLLIALLHRIQTWTAGQARTLSLLERLFKYWLAFLAVYVGVGAVHFGDWGVGLREWVRLASIGSVLYLSTSFALEGHSTQLLRAMFFSLIAPLTVAIWQLTTGNVPLLGGIPRVTGTFYHSTTFAVYLFLFACLTLWKVVTRGDRRWWLALLLVQVIVLVSTYALTALVLVAVVGGYLAWRLRGRLRVVTLVAVVVIALTFVFSRVGSSRVEELRRSGSIKQVIETNRSTNSLTWRIWHWWLLWRQSRDHRWVGTGLGTAQPYVSPIHYDVHSDFLRMFVETGPLGATAYVGLLLMLFRTFRSQTQRSVELDSLGPYARAGTLGVVAASITDNMMAATALQYYLWCLAGIFIGTSMREAPESRPVRPAREESPPNQ